MASARTGDWTLRRDGLAAADDPFAMLVPRREVAAPADVAALVAATAFLRGRALGAEVLRRGVSPDAYVLVPRCAGAGWQLVFDPGAGEMVLDVASFADRAAAIEHANRLRAFLVELNRRSEGAHIVEDVLLRGDDTGFAPMALTVVLAGWSARTRPAGFRHLAEETIALLCPAHLTHAVLWLDHAAMARFEALLLDWRVAFRDARDGRDGPRGGDLGRAGAALRAFLAAAP